MPFVSGADIVSDVLFRAGEIAGSSEWDVKTLDYLNRAYGALCAGSSEFLPETVEDWWWMRANGALILDPMWNDGTISVTNGASGFDFSVSPGMDVTGWRLKVRGHPDVFAIASAGGANGNFDTVYTGDTNAAAEFELFHTVYTLDSAVQTIISPIVSFRENPQLFGTSPERMDFLFPLARLASGVPQAFCLESDTTVRFSHGGMVGGRSMRIEYRYRPIVELLANSATSFPLVPAHYRHLLADMALVYVHSDKNDDRVASVGSQVRAGLMAMVRENHRRLTKIDQNSGHVFPRGHGNSRKILRTETGNIIG